MDEELDGFLSALYIGALGGEMGGGGKYEGRVFGGLYVGGSVGR